MSEDSPSSESVAFLQKDDFKDTPRILEPEASVDHIAEWIEAIRSAPRPERLIIPTITGDTPGKVRRHLADLTARLPVGTQIQASLAANPDMGLAIDNGVVSLSPVDIIAVLKKRNFPLLLNHFGYTRIQVDGKLKSNIDQLRQNGVYGDTSLERGTYLGRYQSRVAPHWIVAAFEPVVFWLDPAILSQYRSVFADPEQFSLIPGGLEAVGDSYFVMGGIPAPAIIAVADQFGNRPTVIDRN